MGKKHSVDEIAKATGLGYGSVDHICSKFIDDCVNKLAKTIGYEQAVYQVHLMLEEDMDVLVRYLRPKTLENLKGEVRRRINDA